MASGNPKLWHAPEFAKDFAKQIIEIEDEGKSYYELPSDSERIPYNQNLLNPTFFPSERLKNFIKQAFFCFHLGYQK